MKQSRRSKRMLRRNRAHRTPAFNLVSLMDIFTILVFFLLVNTSDGEVLPSSRNVQLPESISEERPRPTVVVTVTSDQVLIDGVIAISLAELSNANTELETSMKAALSRYQARFHQSDTTVPPIPQVTIMGDKSTSYQTLKKIMISCNQAGFEQISLAVLQQAPAES